MDTASKRLKHGIENVFFIHIWVMGFMGVLVLYRARARAFNMCSRGSSSLEGNTKHGIETVGN